MSIQRNHQFDGGAMFELFQKLLHERRFGVLATQSQAMPGYPFASVLPFVPDERHWPVFLISQLAEHTQNLRQDPRASLLLFDAENPDVLTAPRATLIGTVTPLEASSTWRRRYLLYQPEASQYIEFADFQFYRLQTQRIRLVAGFGRMGWLDQDALNATEVLPPDQEERLLETFAGTGPAGLRLIGLDRYGIDYVYQDYRHRHTFDQGPIATDSLETALHKWLASEELLGAE